MITLTFTSTVAAGSTADTLTITPTNATAVSGNTVEFEINAASGTQKTVQFTADGAGAVSFSISGSIMDA